jgi:hypothetical protein
MCGNIRSEQVKRQIVARNSVEVYAMASEKTTKRLSLRPALWVGFGSFTACALISIGWGTYVYWNDIKLVNFLAAWIPFALSILLAFVPEHKMSTTKKLLWRSSVILVGFAWSVVLWHQQIITEQTALADQEKIVNNAVTKSNNHSDQQIGEVRKDVQGVKTDLKDTKEVISGMVSKTASDLTISLGKVGKPEPPELAKIQFTLFVDNMTSDKSPLLTQMVHPDSDGTVRFNVSFFNTSGTSAESVDVWLLLCDQCSFTQEPPQFDRPSGLNERMRHAMVPLLNPGTWFIKIPLAIKSTLTAPYQLNIGFKYACKACGKQSPDPQLVHVLVIPDVAAMPPS